jgi:hypothetical protein
MGRRDEPLVMVISAWREGDGVRARIVHGGCGARRTRACASVADLLDAVRDIVDGWERMAPE